jgi:sugar-specific transcriptional regulator TrmB
LEKLVKELMSLGLTSREAQIYVFFGQTNSYKKKEAANQLEIGEQELTESLQRLTRKGFMRSKLDSNTFSCIPLQIVIEKLIKQKLREVKEIKGEIKDSKLDLGSGSDKKSN